MENAIIVVGCMYECKFCLEAGWLIRPELGIMTRASYTSLKRRGQLKTLRRSCKNTPALVEYESLPERYKVRVRKVLGYNPLDNE